MQEEGSREESMVSAAYRPSIGNLSNLQVPRTFQAPLQLIDLGEVGVELLADRVVCLGPPLLLLRHVSPATLEEVGHRPPPASLAQRLERHGLDGLPMRRRVRSGEGLRLVAGDTREPVDGEDELWGDGDTPDLEAELRADNGVQSRAVVLLGRDDVRHGLENALGAGRCRCDGGAVPRELLRANSRAGDGGGGSRSDLILRVLFGLGDEPVDDVEPFLVPGDDAGPDFVRREDGDLANEVEVGRS